MLNNSLNQTQKQFLGLQLFNNYEFEQDIDLGRLKKKSSGTKTDLLVNDKEWLAQFENILNQTNFLEINPLQLNFIYTTLNNARATQTDVKERINIISALLTERKFFIAMLISLVKRLLKVSPFYEQSDQIQVNHKQQQQSFQKEPNIERQLSKFEEENVGKTTPPTLRQVLGSAVTRDGRNMKVPVIIEPRGQIALLKSAKSAKNRESTKFDFISTQSDNGKSEFNRVLLLKASQETPKFPKDQESFASNGYGYDAIGGWPVELTEDAYHIKPSQQYPQTTVFKVPIETESRLQSSENTIQTRYGMHPQSSKNVTQIQNFTKFSANKSSGNNVLKEYNQLFKRKENVQLMHKWDSDDDDDGADIQSSGSKDEIYGNQSFDFAQKKSVLKRKEKTGFEGYGIDTEQDPDRHTGTFTKYEVNQTVENDRNNSPAISANKSSFVSNSKMHNKPDHKTVIKANRANVRNSNKQNFKTQKNRFEMVKVPAGPFKLSRNEATQTNTHNKALIKENSQNTSKSTHNNLFSTIKSSQQMKEISAASTTTLVATQQAIIPLSTQSKNSSQKTLQRNSFNQGNKQMQSDTPKPSQKLKEKQKSIKQAEGYRQTKKDETDDYKDLINANSKIQNKPSAYDAQKELNQIKNTMQPSYQSSNFDKRSSGQSPSQSQLRSRSANRYSVEEDEEDQDQTKPDLVFQLNSEAHLEREQYQFKLDTSIVHSEYQQKPPKSPHNEIQTHYRQSPKSLKGSGKASSSGQHQNQFANQLNDTKSSSIFKNEHLSGSPAISNRMREIQSQESSSAYTNSIKGQQQQITRKNQTKTSKLLPTQELKASDASKQKQTQFEIKEPQKLKSEQTSESAFKANNVMAETLSKKQFETAQKQVQLTTAVSSQDSIQKKQVKESQRYQPTPHSDEQVGIKTMQTNLIVPKQFQEESKEKIVEIPRGSIKLQGITKNQNLNTKQQDLNQNITVSIPQKRPEWGKNATPGPIGFRNQDSDKFQVQDSSAEGSMLKQKVPPKKAFIFQQSTDSFQPKSKEFKVQQSSSIEQKVLMLASRDRGTQNSKINLNDDDFFNDLPLNDDENHQSLKRPFSEISGQQQIEADEDIFDHLRSQDPFEQNRGQSISRTVVLNSNDAPLLQNGQSNLAISDQRQIEADEDIFDHLSQDPFQQNKSQVQLTNQLQNSESYDFGPNFNEISTQPAIESTAVQQNAQKAIIDNSKMLGRNTSTSSALNKQKHQKVYSEQSFRFEENENSTIEVPQNNTPEIKSPDARQLIQTQESQDIYSESSQEADNYFAGVIASNLESSPDRKAMTPDDDDDDLLKNKPSDLKNYDDVFSDEEKAMRDHNLSIIKLQLQRQKSEQKDLGMQQIIADHFNGKNSQKSNSSGKLSKGQSSSRSQSKPFQKIAPTEISLQFLNNISFDDPEEKKEINLTQVNKEQKLSPVSSQTRTRGGEKIQIPKVIGNSLEKRKRDNRKLFNVESSTSLDQDNGVRYDEYGDPVGDLTSKDARKQQGVTLKQNLYGVRGSGTQAKGLQGPSFDIMSGASALSGDSSSFGGELMLNKMQKAPLGFTSSSESGGFQSFLKTQRTRNPTKK